MIQTRLSPALILLACAGALGAALTTQYGFGLPPCILCIYQRIPYVAAGLLAAGALVPWVPPRVRSALIALCAAAFAVDCAIAVFHVGVEQHWWTGLAACTGGGAEAQTVESLKAMLAGPPPVRCDQIPWELFGVSMAGYNALYALCLAIFAGWSARQPKEQG
jgi:disulfide bond formation protein DsbB